MKEGKILHRCWSPLLHLLRCIMLAEETLSGDGNSRRIRKRRKWGKSDSILTPLRRRHFLHKQSRSRGWLS